MRHRPLWIILAVGLLLRAALLAGCWRRPERFFAPDSYGYDELAVSMLLWGEFSRTGDGEAEIFRTPGYPAFLAGVYALSGKSVHAAIGVQIALDVGLCLLVYVLGARLCSRRAGLIAAAAQAVSPVAVAGSVRILSESLFALLLTGAVVLLAEHFRRSRLRTALGAAALMGAACLVRPIGLVAVAVAAGALLCRPRRRRPAVAFVAVAAAIVAPWVVRNYVRAGYARLSGVADYNAFAYNAAAVVEADPRVQLDDEQRELAEAIRDGPDAWLLNDPEFLRRCRRAGWAIIAAHPLRYAGVHLRTTLNVFLPAATDVLEVAGVTTGGKGTLGVLRREGPGPAIRHYFGGALWPLWLAGAMALVTGAKLLAAAVGAARCVRWRMGPALWLIFLLVLCFIVIPGPAAHARFRVAIAPLLSLAAGAGIARLTEKLRKGPHKAEGDKDAGTGAPPRQSTG